MLGLALQGFGQERVLEQYQAQYRKGLESIEMVFREKRLAMPAAQVQALRKLEAEYQRAGDLQGMLAVQQERKRFVLDPRGSAIPSVRTPPDLARLLNAYKARFAEAATARDRSVAALKQRYLEALRKLQVKLTQRGDIAEAKRVMQAISSSGELTAAVPASRPQPQAAPAPSSAPSEPSGATAPPASGDDFFEDWFE